MPGTCGRTAITEGSGTSSCGCACDKTEDRIPIQIQSGQHDRDDVDVLARQDPLPLPGAGRLAGAATAGWRLPGGNGSTRSAGSRAHRLVGDVPSGRGGCQDARVEPRNADHRAVTGIAAAVRGSMEDLVTAAVQDIWDQVPAYPASNDERLREDVAGHVRAIFEVFLAGLTGARPARRSDFTITREQATRRVAQGITLADFLQAFRIGQLTLWHGVLAAAGDDAAAREAALTLVARIMGVIEVGSTVAAAAYVEAQQHAVAESDRLRRDLLEDLLARRASFGGPKRALLRAAGLGPDARLLVTSAALAADQSDDHALRDAALAVGRTRGGSRGLVVVRQEEIVVVAPVPQGGTGAAVAGLRRACDGLRRRQIALAAGVSTERAGLS